MVYFDSASLCYCYPYAVHFFTREKPEPEEIMERAREILRNTFPNFVVAEKKKEDYGGYRAVFVGYEYLPLDTPEFYVAVAFHKYEADVEPEPPRDVAEKIARYRLSRFTVDIDEYKSDSMHPYESLAKALDIAEKINAKNIRVLRTHGGWHVRAELSEPMEYKKLADLRQEAGDDEDRLRIDAKYKWVDHVFLTNILFNEKHWYDDEGILRHYVEKEVPLSEVVIRRKIEIPVGNWVADYGVYDLAKTRIDRIAIFIGEEVYTDNAVLYVEGPATIVTRAFMGRLAKAVDERVGALLRTDQELVSRVVEAYRAVLRNPTVQRVLERAMIVKNPDNTITIYLPRRFYRDDSFGKPVVEPSRGGVVGLLIGRQGSAIKAVGQRLGMRIRIAEPGRLDMLTMQIRGTIISAVRELISSSH
jgi:hypothetical protein